MSMPGRWSRIGRRLITRPGSRGRTCSCRRITGSIRWGGSTGRSRFGLSRFRGLLCRLSVAGLEHVEVSRYWMYGRVQLVEAGRGLSSRVPWKSVLASGPCSNSPVEVVLSEFRSVWPAVDGAAVIGVNMRFVLLDAVTGYRSQKHRKSCVVEL